MRVGDGVAIRRLRVLAVRSVARSDKGDDDPPSDDDEDGWRSHGLSNVTVGGATASSTSAAAASSGSSLGGFSMPCVGGASRVVLGLEEAGPLGYLARAHQDSWRAPLASLRGNSD